MQRYIVTMITVLTQCPRWFLQEFVSFAQQGFTSSNPIRYGERCNDHAFRPPLFLGHIRCSIHWSGIWASTSRLASPVLLVLRRVDVKEIHLQHLASLKLSKFVCYALFFPRPQPCFHHNFLSSHVSYIADTYPFHIHRPNESKEKRTEEVILEEIDT